MAMLSIRDLTVGVRKISDWVLEQGKGLMIRISLIGKDVDNLERPFLEYLLTEYRFTSNLMGDLRLIAQSGLLGGGLEIVGGTSADLIELRKLENDPDEGIREAARRAIRGIIMDPSMSADIVKDSDSSQLSDSFVSLGNSAHFIPGTIDVDFDSDRNRFAIKAFIRMSPVFAGVADFYFWFGQQGKNNWRAVRVRSVEGPSFNDGSKDTVLYEISGEIDNPEAIRDAGTEKYAVTLFAGVKGVAPDPLNSQYVKKWAGDDGVHDELLLIHGDVRLWNRELSETEQSLFRKWSVFGEWFGKIELLKVMLGLTKDTTISVPPGFSLLKNDINRILSLDERDLRARVQSLAFLKTDRVRAILAEAGFAWLEPELWKWILGKNFETNNDYSRSDAINPAWLQAFEEFGVELMRDHVYVDRFRRGDSNVLFSMVRWVKNLSSIDSELRATLQSDLLSFLYAATYGSVPKLDKPLVFFHGTTEKKWNEIKQTRQLIPVSYLSFEQSGSSAVVFSRAGMTGGDGSGVVFLAFDARQLILAGCVPRLGLSLELKEVVFSDPVPLAAIINDRSQLPSLIDEASIADLEQMKNANNGGIDLNYNRLNLKTQNAGSGIDFHLDPAQLQQIQNATGFLPVIIGIQPMNDLGLFLGLSAPDIAGAGPG